MMMKENRRIKSALNKECKFFNTNTIHYAEIHSHDDLTSLMELNVSNLNV